MKADVIVIQRPERQPKAQRYLFAFATASAWIAWSWLWLPLVTLAAWGFGLRNGYVQLVMLKHGMGARDLLIVVAIGLACVMLSLAWSGYNLLRYGKLDRRRNRPVADRLAMACALNVLPPTAIEMHRAQRIVLEFRHDGSVSHRHERLPSAALAQSAR
ncbi:poly-beta-1,6-N-acetyl-D-glucosamine biosynthesis protein PgaD [Burkholderia sp. TSV86]|uniref:poly-beta-1,6-N-acetyl-D-glucosamine biosynthesis protein PgaD n=1 Tax=Burkholderia sp. TSV86 TaxID=1385594 RepID=UPI000752E48D|nr:poly-beta-1,6-N-acetyl-D-glucosamine biosynthesis protein PgaD [Burkholderia sp. TSV86]KVE36491.1 hypothetical protein WS68_00735 [Burkholderia sp. TSV86]